MDADILSVFVQGEIKWTDPRLVKRLPRSQPTSSVASRQKQTNGSGYCVTYWGIKMTIILTGWTRENQWYVTLYENGVAIAVGKGDSLNSAHADLLINEVLED